MPSPIDLRPTLVQVLARGGRLYAVCKQCHRRSALDLHPLIESFGALTALREVEPKLRCTQCGARRADLFWSTSPDDA
jgi:hypothetical protein